MTSKYTDEEIRFHRLFSEFRIFDSVRIRGKKRFVPFSMLPTNYERNDKNTRYQFLEEYFLVASVCYDAADLYAEKKVKTPEPVDIDADLDLEGLYERIDKKQELESIEYIASYHFCCRSDILNGNGHYREAQSKIAQIEIKTHTPEDLQQMREDMELYDKLACFFAGGPTKMHTICGLISSNYGREKITNELKRAKIRMLMNIFYRVTINHWEFYLRWLDGKGFPNAREKLIRDHTEKEFYEMQNEIIALACDEPLDDDQLAK